MTIDELIANVKKIDIKGELTWDLAQSLERSEQSRNAFSKEIQKSLIRWLASYKQTGATIRKTLIITEARFFYNHLQNAVWLSWLAEAAGTAEPILRAAADAVLKAGENKASQCAAFRMVVPWEDIERGLLTNP